MENGKRKELKCRKCNQTTRFWINQFYAKESKFLGVFSGLILLLGFVIGIYIIWNMIRELKTIIGIVVVAAGLLAPIWIYTIIKQEDRRRVKTFNQTYVKESFE